MTSNDLVILCNHHLPAVDWEVDDECSVVGRRYGQAVRGQMTHFRVIYYDSTYEIVVNHILVSGNFETLREAMDSLRDLADEAQAQAAFMRESVECLAIVASKPLGGGAL